MTSIRQQLADRIRDYDNAQATPLFVEVADSGQLDDVLNNANTTEGCYVVKLERTAKSDSDYYQRVTERYQIVTVCQNYSDSYGSAVGELAEAMQDVVFKALSGYCPHIEGGDVDPVQFETGGLVDLRNHLHVWADIYQLEYTQQLNQQS